MKTVTVLSSPERRRRWTASEKLRLVADSAASGLSVADFARRHDVHPNLVCTENLNTGVAVVKSAQDGA